MIKNKIKKLKIVKSILNYRNFLHNKRLKTKLIKNGKEILSIAVDVLEKNKINYWLDYGTLLGAIRNKGFIKGDMDIDLGIDIKEDIDHIIKIFQNKGFNVYCYYHVIPEEKGRIVSLIYKGIILDLYNYTINEKSMWCTIYEQDKCNSIDNFYKENNTIPVFFLKFNFKIITKKIKLFDLNVSVPSNYHEYLSTIYGTDYMVEKQKWSGSLNKKFQKNLTSKIKY